MVNCDRCGSSDVAKKGFRKTQIGAKQKYQCCACTHWFIEDDGFKKMRHKPEIIARAIHQFSDGFSLEKVRNHLRQHDATTVSRWTIRKWAVKYSRTLKKTSRKRMFQRLWGASISMKKESA